MKNESNNKNREKRLNLIYAILFPIGMILCTVSIYLATREYTYSGDIPPGIIAPSILGLSATITGIWANIELVKIQAYKDKEREEKQYGPSQNNRRS